MRGERGDGAWVWAGAEVVGGCAGGVDARDAPHEGVVGVVRGGGVGGVGGGGGGEVVEDGGG